MLFHLANSMLPILVDPRQILGSVPPKPKREKGNKNYRHPKPRSTFQSFTSRQNLPLDLDVPRPAAHATAEPTLATFFLNKEVYSSAKHEASQACRSDSLPPHTTSKIHVVTTGNLQIICWRLIFSLLLLVTELCKYVT